MKLLQRILSRGLLISVAILAAIAFHFRATLFPQWFGAGAETQQTAKAGTATPPPVATDSVSTIPEQSAAPSNPAPAPMRATGNPDLPPLIEDVPARNSAEDQSADQSSTVMAMDSAQGSSAPNTTAVDATAVDATAIDTATVPLIPPANVSGQIAAAREAYWQQDFESAERLYREAAVMDTHDADALGELGNIYYTQGRWNDAAEAYAGAVERLLGSGQQQRAAYLMTVLDGLDPARAQAFRTSAIHEGG